MTIEEVYARLVEIRRATLSPKRGISPTFGIHKSRFKGIGFEFAGIEEWRPGEPLSDIAWRMSLKYLPERIFKIRRRESKQMPIVLAVDLTPSMRFQIREGSSKARLLFELMGAIGFSGIRQRDPVGAIGFSDEIELFLSPRTSGKRILYIVKKIFERINLLEGHDLSGHSVVEGKANMNATLQFLYRKYKSRHLIVLLSDFIDVMNDPSSINWELLQMAAARHDIVALVLHDADEFGWNSSGTVIVKNPESGHLERIKGSRGFKIRETILRKRGELVEKLRQSGIDSLAISYDHYRSDLYGFFRSRRRVFR